MFDFLGASIYSSIVTAEEEEKESSYVTFYVDSSISNNNTECGATLDNACGSISSAINSYQVQGMSAIPLVIELADGMYTSTSNSDLQLIGMNITFQPQSSSDNVTLYVDGQTFISVSGKAENLTSITVRNIIAVGALSNSGFIGVQANSDVFISIENCSISNFSLPLSIALNQTSYYYDSKYISKSSYSNNNTLVMVIRDSILKSNRNQVLNSENSKISIINTVITGNSARPYSDWSMYFFRSSLLFSGSKYISNAAIFHIDLNYSNLTVVDSTFEDNNGMGLSNTYLFTPSDNNLISGSTFSNNKKMININLNNNKNTTISNCSFTNNIAPTNGLVYQSASSLIMNGCIFTNNTVEQSILVSVSQTFLSDFLYVNNSKFYNNSFLNVNSGSSNGASSDISLDIIRTTIENTEFNEFQKVDTISCTKSSLTLNGNRIAGNSMNNVICGSCEIYGTDSKKCSSKLNNSQVAGIVLGIIFGSAFIVLLSYILYKRHENSKKMLPINQY